MVPTMRGSGFVMRGGHLVGRAVLVAGLTLGFALGGCGRKGSLDMPPSASISNVQPVEPPPALGAPPPQRKTFFLDWLLR
jgi:predicted small lipoprotein YifL